MVRAEEEITQGETRRLCQEVPTCLGVQGTQDIGRQRAAGDVVLRPRENGDGNQKNVVLCALMLKCTGFRTRLNQISQFIMGVGISLDETIEAGFLRSADREEILDLAADGAGRAFTGGM